MKIRNAFRYDIALSKRRREPGIITGVRNICRYMQIGPNTFYKLHMEHALPAMQLPDGRWCTSRNLIDDWIISRWEAQKAALEPPIIDGEETESVPLLDVPEPYAGALREAGGKESYEAHLS